MVKLINSLAMIIAFISIAHAHLIQGGVNSKQIMIVTLIDKGFKLLDFSKTKVLINGGEYTGFVDNMGSFNM